MPARRAVNDPSRSAERTDTETETETVPSDPTRLARRLLDGDGAYARQEDGTWIDTLSGDAVPGATDIALRDLYDPPVETQAGATVRLIPRAWASRHPDHPLAWIFAYADLADLGGRDDVAIPVTVWEERAADVVAMSAPELHHYQLIGVDGVAAHLGVTRATVRSYLARRQMPPPVARLGGSPVWPRPRIDRWMRSRRGAPRLATAEPEMPASTTTG